MCITLGIRVEYASAPRAQAVRVQSRLSANREFKDVVFEDVAFDNNRFGIDLTIENNR